ncbi:MAG TPA: hypothetical protein VFA18_03915, partial [Gemmataceae bacterium]|nr:hypothetical protein [Gemmataceae bacterium]
MPHTLISPSMHDKAPTPSGAAEPLTWSVLPAENEECRSPQVLATWRSRIEASQNPRAIYQCPEYCDHVRLVEGGKIFLALPRDSSGNLVGIAPLRLWPDYPLGFRIRGHTLARYRMPVVQLLGTHPLVPHTPETWDKLLTTVATALPE